MPISFAKFGIACLLLLPSAGCHKSQGEDSSAPSKQKAQAALEAEAPPSKHAPQPALKAEANKRGTPLGRWRGDELCVELLANGDVEISFPRADPKVLLMGRGALQETQADQFALQLSEAKIWKGRYVSPCREIHEYGDWANEIDVLGSKLLTGGSASFKITRKSATEIEFCAERCVLLQHDEALLGARWRREGIDIPDQAKVGWALGDFLELDLREPSPHLWVGLEARAIGTIDVHSKLSATSQDHFALQVTPHGFRDAPDPSLLRVLGKKASVNRAIELQLTRLSGQRLEVCADRKHCQVLERQFDGDRYELH